MPLSRTCMETALLSTGSKNHMSMSRFCIEGEGEKGRAFISLVFFEQSVKSAVTLGAVALQ